MARRRKSRHGRRRKLTKAQRRRIALRNLKKARAARKRKSRKGKRRSRRSRKSRSRKSSRRRASRRSGVMQTLIKRGYSPERAYKIAERLQRMKVSAAMRGERARETLANAFGGFAAAAKAAKALG